MVRMVPMMPSIKLERLFICTIRREELRPLIFKKTITNKPKLMMMSSVSLKKTKRIRKIRRRARKRTKKVKMMMMLKKKSLI